jgi:serine/threonine-protein kinase
MTSTDAGSGQSTPPDGNPNPNGGTGASTPATPPPGGTPGLPDGAGTTFGGRYELNRKLARGGMADVYLAEDTLLNRPVAVKVLFSEYARDETFVERFRREAQAAARLTHGNIVAIHDWGAEYGTYYIVMEYVEGSSLSEVIRSRGPLEARQAATVTARVASALEFAHRNGVVHRDVKPGNIMISSTGSVKVADFGIAQALSSAERASLTQTGAVMGTATYFSPEQAQGKAIDPRSDLYSLGCVLFEALTGRPPFNGDSPVAIAYKHVQEPVPDVAAVAASVGAPPVPPDLARVVGTLLAKDPDDRYASAGDLEADLDRFLTGQAVTAPGAPGPVAATTTMAAATGAAAFGGAVGAGGGSQPPQGPDPGTEPPGGKGRGWKLAALVGGLVAAAAVLVLVGINLSNNEADQVVVPQVINLPIDEAREILTAEGLDVREVAEVNDNVAEGVVFDQDPSGGSRVAVGSEVTLTVSAGVGDAQVPDVVGRREAEAVRLLSNAGFTSTTREEPNDDVAEGRVISQDPPAGASTKKGSEVTIVVSEGSTTAEVPNVVGQSEGVAANQLGQAGLTVNTESQFSDSVPAGVVITQDPPPGTRLSRNSAVTIVVSRGPEPTTTTTTTTTTAPPTTTTTTAAPASVPTPRVR